MLLKGNTLEGREISFKAEDVRHVLNVDGRVIWSIYPDGDAYYCFFVYPETVGM